MIPLNPARLPAALKLLAEFRAAGRAPAPVKPPVHAGAAAREGGHASRGAGPPGKAPSSADLQRSPAGWPVTRDVLAAQLERRLTGHDLPYQFNTSYCGCAAFLVALLVDRPDLYTSYAIGLWTGDHFTFQGKDGAKLTVSAASGTMTTLAGIQAGDKSRTSAISDIDWMTMASLSGSSHSGPAQPVAAPKGLKSTWNAITWPSMMRNWFTSVGAAPGLDSVGLGAISRSASDFLDLLALWSNHWIILEIDVSLLEGGIALPTNRHWVLVNPLYPPKVRAAGAKTAESPAALKNAYQNRWTGGGPALGSDPSADLVSMKFGSGVAADILLDEAVVDMQVISWAQDWHTFKNPTLSHIASRFYGGYACPRFR